MQCNEGCGECKVVRMVCVVVVLMRDAFLMPAASEYGQAGYQRSTVEVVSCNRDEVSSN